MRYLLLVWLPLVTFPGGLAAQEKVSQREELPSPVDVYVSGVGGYHTYRIPSLLTVTLKVWLKVALSLLVFKLPSRPASSTVTVIVVLPY